MTAETADRDACAETSRAGSGSRRRLLACPALLAAFAWLLGVVPANAAPTWLTPAKLSATGQNAERPQVSVDEHGDGLAVWARLDGATGKNVVEASARSAGGSSWQGATPISDGKVEASVPQVALDSHGDARAVWLSFDGSEYSIQSSFRTGLAGSWQPPATVRKLGVTIPPDSRPDLAVNAQGAAVVVWERMEGGKTLVEASSAANAAASWGSPELLTEGAEGLHPAEVAVDASGVATAVWEAKGTPVQIDAARRPSGGAWQPGVALSAAEGNANEPRVAVDARGDAVAIWERFGGTEELIEAASRPAGSAAWGKPVALSQPEGGKGEPAGQQVGIGGQGEAVVAWSRTNAASHDVVEAVVGNATNSAWKAPVALSAPAGTVEEAPQVGVDSAAGAVVVWEQWSGAKKIVEAASGVAASGSWQPAVALSAEGQEADEQQVGLDAQGNAIAVWKRFDGASYIAEAAGFDAAGPQLNSLAIPTTGTVGQALGFSVSPFDVWSALGATSWSLGDGITQAGASIVHAYGKAGTFSVSVTSADALGNVTSAHGTVSILAPAAVAPKIAHAGLSHARFRVSRHATAISARAKTPLGTTFRFSLSEAAKLQIEFTRSAAGLRSGKRCAAPSARLRSRHAKRCTRAVGAGTLVRALEHAGTDRLAFSGRLGRHALPPGSYRAVLLAAAGGLRSAPVTLSFRVVR